jgi:hypothetical protein
MMTYQSHITMDYVNSCIIFLLFYQHALLQLMEEDPDEARTIMRGLKDQLKSGGQKCMQQ